MTPAPEDRREAGSVSRAPLVTLTLVACALGLFVWPGAGELLQYDRGAIAGGQVWRVVTGHLVHFNSEHLIWDLLVVAVVGALCERHHRTRYGIALTVAALLIPAAIWRVQPQMWTYRGLSGLASTAFGFLMMAELRIAWARKQRAFAVVLFLVTAGFAAKIAYEFITGGTVFAEVPAGMVPTPLAHVVGFLVGVGCAPHAVATDGRMDP